MFALAKAVATVESNFNLSTHPLITKVAFPFPSASNLTSCRFIPTALLVPAVNAVSLAVKVPTKGCPALIVALALPLTTTGKAS